MLIFDRLKTIKAFVFDVDGVLTNGEVLVTESGDQLRTFHIKDGYALQLAVKRKYPIAAITGGRSEGVRLRLEGLGIQSIFLNVSDKISVLHQWMRNNGLHSQEVLFMGDDVPDLPAMKEVGLAACPADAVEDIKAIAHYISPAMGGRGAVRDVVEKVLRLQGKWDLDPEIKSI